MVKGLTQQNVMQEEIEKFLLNGAIQLVSPSNGQFVSRLFLVPKKTGDLRPVINLRPLNKFIIRKHFKMENLQNVTQLVRKGDYMVTIDFKDAYFSIPIHQSHRKFLRFSWRNQLFQFAALPFGLTSAPRVFTKVLKPVIASMRQRGIRCLIYIDDLIIVASSKMECNEQAVFAVQLLTDLGFNVNMEKSNLVPKTRVEFLGFVLDSIRMELFLPEKKKENILQRIRNLLMSRQILVRQVSSMVGLMQSAKWAVMPAVIYYRFLQRDLNSALEETGRDYDSLIMLSQEARQELKMWLTNLEMWHGRAMVMSRPSLIIQTDASLLGWGAVLPEYRQGGQRFVVERGNHVTHQCVRANDGMVCNSNACKCYNGGTCSFSNGQYNRGVLHKQTRWNKVLSNGHNCQENLGLGHKSIKFKYQPNICQESRMWRRTSYHENWTTTLNGHWIRKCFAS